MKKQFLAILVFAFLFGKVYIANAQAPLTTNNSRWDLDKYVWSQTHHDPTKAGKRMIDFEALDNWESLKDGNPVISRDGKYFAYQVEKGPGEYKKDDSLIIQSTTNGWRQSFAGAQPGIFSSDSRKYLFQDKEDLCIVFLKEGMDHYIREISSYKTPPGDKVEWLAYQLKDNDQTVVLLNLASDKQQQFKGMKDYSFDRSNHWLSCTTSAGELLLYNLLLDKEEHYGSMNSYTISEDGNKLLIKKNNNGIEYTDLATKKTTIICEQSNNKGMKPVSYNFDKTGEQVAIVMSDTAKNNSIWYWKTGMDKAIQVVNSQTAGIDASLLIGSSTRFISNDRYIQFSLQPKPVINHPNADAVMVDVWSYQDKILQSTQSHLLQEAVRYTAILNLESNHVIRLGNEKEKLELLSRDFALIKKSGRATNGDSYWEKGDRFWEKDFWADSNWVVSLQDGSRRLLSTNGGFARFWFSPGGRYLVYYDAEKQGNYFSYELRTGKLINISKGTPVYQFGHVDPYLRTNEKPDKPVGIAGWLENDGGLLVFDNYDIWQLDLEGNTHPVNITNGYGQSHQILFSVMGTDRSLPTGQPILSANSTLILRAFNLQTKYNGYYRKVLNSPENPELLYMGACFMETMPGLGVLDAGMHPIKAAGADTWIVKRQTATDAPNYFVTSDFKEYKRLTNLQPQKEYNWLTTELIHFKQLDGTMSQGVLYKPENFDPTKKYPVIISFYYNLSDQLYQYSRPNYITVANIEDSPAWMVSHGYLVLLPDIYFTKGQWGPGVVNTMDGANRYLQKLPYVDGNSIGACGHSNSGRFGYYLLTHSKSFAAMSIGAGYGGTDLVSLALSEDDGLFFVEKEAAGSGLGQLWKNKQIWLDHQAIVQADHVTSPLLLFHNEKDGDPVRYAKELFTSLRRLEKKVWWLQYDKGAHTLWEKNEMRDYTIRYTQFFDHYLKGAPPPEWMCEGIPYQYKGIESKYELNPNGSCGKNCSICKASHSLIGLKN